MQARQSRGDFSWSKEVSEEVNRKIIYLYTEKRKIESVCWQSLFECLPSI